MKVSRKVGRRSRCSYSVSRRRLRNKKTKSGYRKKHTHRGGKHGKRGRGHKHARTHKRGRRFHRGGKLITFFTRPGPTSFSETTGIITDLNYTKTSPGKTPSMRFDNFKVLVIVEGGNIIIRFRRTPEKANGPLEFTFGPNDNLNDVISIIKNSLNQDNPIKNTSAHDGNVLYQLTCSDAEIVDSIEMYIRTNYHALTKKKPVESFKEFYSSDNP